jgi:hypothetical protein
MNRDTSYSSRRIGAAEVCLRLDDPEGPGAVGVAAAVATREELRVSSPTSAAPEGRTADDGLRTVESFRIV